MGDCFNLVCDNCEAMVHVTGYDEDEIRQRICLVCHHKGFTRCHRC